MLKFYCPNKARLTKTNMNYRTKRADSFNPQIKNDFSDNS